MTERPCPCPEIAALCLKVADLEAALDHSNGIKQAKQQYIRDLRRVIRRKDAELRLAHTEGGAPPPGDLP